MKLDFLFIGPNKTGTTWIYELLKNHSQISLPVHVKETRYYDRYFNRGSSWYKKKFIKGSGKKIFGEIAPTYFGCSNIIPNRIKLNNDSIKIFINIRDPLPRLISMYRHLRKKGNIIETITEAIKTNPDIITSGSYLMHCSNWIDTFSKKNVFFIPFTDIIENPQELYSNICNILCIEKQEMPNIIGKRFSKSKSIRFELFSKPLSSTIDFLHSIDWHWLVNIGKWLGFKNIFYKNIPLNYNDIDANELIELRTVLKEEYEYLSKLGYEF